MALPFRCLNWLLLVFTALLEIGALVTLCMVLRSHCILGVEYAISVWFYAYFLPAILVHTAILAISRIFLITAGLDPIAVCFNIISGIILFIATLIQLFAMIWHCQNELAPMFYASGALGLIASILHIINGGMCLHYMPGEEAHYLKPLKRRHQDEYA